MEGLNIGFLFVLCCLCRVLITSCSAISDSCMRVYDQGGASAVLRSPECLQWNPTTQTHVANTHNCHFSSIQGRRKYQEDRVSCNLDFSIPLSRKETTEPSNIGVVAIFDGHLGKEASDTASKLLLDYLYVNTVFGSYKNGFDEPMKVLRHALFKTIVEIDQEFTKIALSDKIYAGSTAIVALLFKDQILIGHVGDSRAFLCSEKERNNLSAEELTVDHRPDREDERARIEGSGGYVAMYWPDGSSYLNGKLPMSRAIGDVHLKEYGLIAEPEITGWRKISGNDRFLVLSSDGMFESLSSQEGCDLLWDSSKGICGVNQEGKNLEQSMSCSFSSSLAQCVVNTAYDRGSADNLSVVVVPLK